MILESRKKYFIILVVCFIFGLFSVQAYIHNSVVEVTESVNLSDMTAFNIVYADAYTADLDNAEVFVSLNETLLEDLENTMQSAIIKSNEEYIAEQKKIIEEKRRQEELQKYYDSVKDKIIAEKDGAIFTYDPYVKSNLSIEQYNIILKGTGLEGCGESYYNMEQTYNVNGLFALSVACQESGFGRYLANTNNFYGMRSSKGWMSFETPDANIQYFGKLMNKSLYYGKDILGIAKTYCPGTHEHWASCVRSLMQRNFNLLLK